MGSITFFDRFRVAAVIWAIFVLIVGISDVFVDTSTIRDLVFHSTIFWIIFTGAGLLIAPYLARLVPVRTESGQPFGGWAIVLLGVVAMIAVVSIAIEVIEH